MHPFFIATRICAFAALLLLAACSSPEEREAEHMKNGKALFESGELAKAAIEFRNALQINPTGVEAKYFTGLIFEKQGNLPAAMSAYQDVALQDPNHRDAVEKLGQYALMNGDPTEASTRADKLIALAPSEPDGHTMKAAAYLMAGKYAEAESEANAAFAIKPNDPDTVIVLASQRARQGRFSEAEAEVEKGLAANPGNTQLLGLKLKLLTDQKRTAEAEQVLRQLIVADPSNPAYVVALARQLAEAGQVTEAREEFRRAIAANKNSDLLLAAYADFLERALGQDEAIAEAQMLVDQFGGNPRYAFLLARLSTKAGKLDDAERVLRALTETLERSSDKLDARVELARITLLRGDKDGALDQLGQILKEDSKNQNALVMRAGIRLSDSKFDPAIADARAALRDNPASIPALLVLSQAYVATNERELAIGTLRDLITVAPANTEARQQLAGLLVVKSPDEAVKQLDAILALKPDDADLKAKKAQILIYSKRWDQGEVIGQELKADPATAALGYQIVGEAALARQDFETAIVELKSSIDLGRSFSVVGPKLMEAYKRSNQPVLASQTGTMPQSDGEALLLARIAEDPKDGDALALLADLREQQGKTQEAQDLLARAIDAKPEVRQPYLNLARLQKTAGDPKAAVATLLRAEQRFPDDSLVLGSVAIGHELNGDYEAARAAYEKVLAKRPGDVVSANNLAMLIADVWPEDKVKLDRARALVEDFRNSSNPTLLDTLGWVQVRLGNVEDATIALKKAVTLEPDNQQLLYHYATALSMKGLGDLAKETMAKALSGQPDFRGVEHARQLAATFK